MVETKESEVTASSKKEAFLNAMSKVLDIIPCYFFLGGPVLAFLLSLFFLSYSKTDFFIWLIFHFIMVAGIGVGYHRYFSHKSFEVDRFGQFLIGLWGTLSMQRGPMWWASTHRVHHRYCGTKNDPHTPSKGFFYSHFRWVMMPENRKIQWKYIRDLSKYPELHVLEYSYLILLPLISFLFYWYFGLSAMFAYQLAVFTSINAIASVNSLCHNRKEQQCEAKNVGWLALFGAGEGLHLNHHDHPGSANCSAKWYQIDLSFLLIRLMYAIGLVKSIRITLGSDHDKEEIVEKQNIPENDGAQL